MTTWQRYVTQNPMRAETRRAFRKFFGLGKLSPGALRAGIVVICGLYILTVVLAFMEAQAVFTGIGMSLEVLVLLLVPAIGFYASISGERERRTWDILRVAPVTEGQIVAGKFMGGALVVLSVWLATLPFILVCGIQNEGLRSPEPLGSKLESALLSSSIPLVASLFVLAMTMFLSARCRTSLAALCISLGALFCWNAILPMLTGALLGAHELASLRMLTTMNPFEIAVYALQPRHLTGDDGLSFGYQPIFVFWVFGVAATLGLLIWTERTLVFVENDVRFLPRSKNAGS